MLKIARMFYGYTQVELAGKIGKSQKYYTQIETGISKSAPIIEKLVDVLKINESFLTSSGEYIEYPFLSDFYVFCLTEKPLFELYKHIAEYICSKSEFIDIVFLLVRPSKAARPLGGGYPIMYIAIRDDRNTIFLFKRRMRTRSFRLKLQGSDNEIIEINIFSGVESFRNMLHSLPETYVHEMTKMVSNELYERIENGSVTKQDIFQLFPDDDYFKAQYEVHTRIKKR